MQELTASEPLSLEEEYAMCGAWRDDADKVTFILLDRGAPPAPEQAGWPLGGRTGAMAGDGERSGGLPCCLRVRRLWVRVEVEQAWRESVINSGVARRGVPARRSAAGPEAHPLLPLPPVNAFFNDPEDCAAVEVEVMVAEPASRRRGVALEALRLFMAYLHRELGVASFTAKIAQDNAPSIALFTRRLGFQELRRVEVGGRGRLRRVPPISVLAAQGLRCPVCQPLVQRCHVLAAHVAAASLRPSSHAAQVFKEVHFQLRVEGEVAAALAEEGSKLRLGSYE